MITSSREGRNVIITTCQSADKFLMMSDLHWDNPHCDRKLLKAHLDKCLAENIYFEAGHEPLEGKKAVAFVTLNRVQSGYADNICDVVKQKTGKTCQFSWYCDSTFTSRTLTMKQTPLYNEILQLSTNVFLNFERMTDVTNGATYYHADYVKPNWTRLQKETQIGRHIFYKSKIDTIDRTKGIISYE